MLSSHNMAKDNNTIVIDKSIWATQQQYAKETGVKLNTISQQIKRTKEGKTVNPVIFWEIPELNNLVLIKRK